MEVTMIHTSVLFCLFVCMACMCNGSHVIDIEEIKEEHHREKRFPKVPMGTMCDSNSDCPSSHCCAMHFGRQVCRRRPGVGHTCVNRPNPIQPDQLFTRCPCSSGLHCSIPNGRRKGVCATG